MPDPAQRPRVEVSEEAVELAAKEMVGMIFPDDKQAWKLAEDIDRGYAREIARAALEAAAPVLQPASDFEVFEAEDGEPAIRMTDAAALAEARRIIAAQRAEIDGYKRELRAAPALQDDEVERLRRELDKTERLLGHALTCAQYGLSEVNWQDVEHWLRRDEPQSTYFAGPRQKAACDRCAQGVMDVDTPAGPGNDHLYGRCKCPCHRLSVPQEDAEGEEK